MHTTERHTAIFQRFDLDSPSESTYRAWVSAMETFQYVNTKQLFVACDARDNSVDAMQTMRLSTSRMLQQYKAYSVRYIQDELQMEGYVSLYRTMGTSSRFNPTV